MTAAPAADGSDWRLLLPLGAFFVLFFAAPLVVLFLVSLSDGLAFNTFSPAHYAKFLGDAFSLSILLDTLVLGVKATAVCLLFGLPVAWVCVNGSPRLRSLLLFLVILPLWLPGLVAGSILVFAACTTAFVTQTLIGGARLVYMPLYIYQQATGANNWPFAAAMSVLLMISVLLVVYLLNLFGRARWAVRHG